MKASKEKVFLSMDVHRAEPLTRCSVPGLGGLTPGGPGQAAVINAGEEGRKEGNNPK